LGYYSKEEYSLSHFTIVDVYCDAVLSELSKNRSATQAFRTEATPVSSGCKNSYRLFCQNVWDWLPSDVMYPRRMEPSSTLPLNHPVSNSSSSSYKNY